MCEHVLGLTCYASGLILSGINLVQIIATEALWIWGREIQGKLKGGVSLATQSCFAKLFIIYCIWSSNEVGERHNIPTAIHSHWRSVILLGLLILCILLSFLMSITAGLVSVVKLFTYSSLSKRCCAHTTEKMSNCGLLRSIILKVVSDRNISFVVLCEAEGIGVQRLQLLRVFICSWEFTLNSQAFLFGHLKFNTNFAIHWSVIYSEKPAPLEYSVTDLLDFKCMWLMKFN